jgi:adenylate cyclase
VSEVFISYKRENLAAVNRLVQGLRAEGVSVWWDQDIPPNAPWEATIERELAAAKLVIVAWSPASVASDNVKAEARWARGQGRLLQVFVEACDPPLFFGERQGVDLKGWSGLATDAAFRTLLQAVRAGPPQAPAEAASAASPVAEPLALPPLPSIAVMPFANLSGDPDQEYFADGMVAEITTALSRIRSIFVIASSSTFSFKGKSVSAQEVARQLGVRFVLEGNVRKAGDRLRIAVQLIDASGGAQIWADRFDDSLEDIFDLQDRVALAVAAKIEPTVRQAEVLRASARPTKNMGSYDLYLRALPLFYRLDRVGLTEALALLNQAITLDPNHGLALVLAAGCHTEIGLAGWAEDPDNNRRRGIERARAALKAAGHDAMVLAWASFAAGYLELDLENAVALADRAIAMNPGCAMAWLGSADARRRAGDADLAVEHVERAMRLDPVGADRPGQLFCKAAARFEQGRFGDVISLSREMAHHFDENPGPHAFLAASYGHLGQVEHAKEALSRFAALTPQPIDAWAPGFFPDRTRLKLFLDGIALAEGRRPSAPGVTAE